VKTPDVNLRMNVVDKPLRMKYGLKQLIVEFIFAGKLKESLKDSASNTSTMTILFLYTRNMILRKS
jgi:hypothetical protein